MTTTENDINAASVPAPGIRPRPVVDRLPRYAAGKPPVVIEGLESYKLSSNENPFPPLPSVLEAISAHPNVNRYPDPLATALRTELASFLDVPAEDIVTGAGSLGALNQLLATFTGQNEDGVQDEVVYPWRSFEAYPISVGLSGARDVQVPLRSDGHHDLDAMAAAVTDRTKMVLLCTPNNPTGPVLTRDEVEGFLAKVPEDVIVVIDEAYEDFVRDPEAVNGVDVYRRHQNVVVLRTFSKGAGLAGLRVGYSISHPHLTQYLRVAAVPFAVSQIAEQAAVASLRHHSELVERIQALVAERTRVVDGLKALGWDIPQAEGNFVWLALGENTPEFAVLAEQQALSVRAFGTEGVRVTIGEAEANSRFLALCATYTKGPRVS
ncbi:histidinol-phosphate transaminase [Arthrobacter caoxuetaonis]|uniref:Aromatic amino acid aminotransferase n=1 Tax=Arthrobacter caoxuetaonis TaxID=2886935 RepID=A0A9X1MEM8_9MICC|nr:histidinol-phosphate transaminase [Arthrobacter caoxuetaonis]MCC3281892.1 histidinol-phosphate transaminase [Arthrobacter caoxuetaonis]MCC3283069.1 histidinol-phosphate transaminase [Arthrobacter caoxuetaonis]MCC3298186.1 histidinol-phosphate transaminase [Arthrobacter caoxuetaonis]USQ57189.1 histidinol-phosphate transaminase [Arthrobacter caoxuetaonis]